MSELDLHNRLREIFGERHINMVVNRDEGRVIIVVWTVSDVQAYVLGLGVGATFEEAAKDLVGA